jgi:hypothetical protein
VLRLRGVGASKRRSPGSLEANYRFIVHARQDIPDLLAALDEITQERDAALQHLRSRCKCDDCISVIYVGDEP